MIGLLLLGAISLYHGYSLKTRPSNEAYWNENDPFHSGVYLKAEDDIVIRLNKGIDTVLEFARAALDSGDFSISLPDLKKPFGHPPYNGNFIATDGFFKDPASLHRTGDVQVVKHGDSISLQVAVGLAHLEAGFEKYTLDILGIHQAGLINVTVAHNSLKMKLTLTYSPACSFKFDYIEFDQLDGINVNITGLGVFQTMFDELSHWLISNFEATFRQIVNKKLSTKLNDVLAKKNVCKYFPQ